MTSLPCGPPDGTPGASLARVLAFAALTLSVAATPGAALDALFEQAWTQNPAVLRARADVESAEASLAGASPLFANPELQSSVGSDAPFGAEGELDFDIGIAQEFAWPGARWSRVSAGEAAVTAARVRLTAARLDVAADVERAYANVVAARASQKARNELVRVARAMGEAARRKLESGSIGELEATLVRADAASAESAARFSQAELAAAEAALCNAVGRDAREECASHGDALAWPSLVAFDRARVMQNKNDDVAQRLDVRAARSAREAAQHGVDAAGVAWLPTVRIGAGYESQQTAYQAPTADGGVQSFLDADQMVTASLSITLPVWDWRRQDVLAARATATRAEADMREAALRARSTVPAALAAYDAAEEAVKSLGAVQGDIEKALADIERAYDAGALPLDQALTSRDRLLKARLDSIEAQRRRVVAHADLLRALSLPLVPGVEVEVEVTQ